MKILLVYNIHIHTLIMNYISLVFYHCLIEDDISYEFVSVVI